MERVKKLVESLRNRPRPATEEELVNGVREYLQVLILKLIYQSKFGAALSFMGGTCLRICYDLKRYSEDLDFAFDDRRSPYRFSALLELLERELQLHGFHTSLNVHEDKRVQKAFISFAGLPEILGLRSFRREQKIHIKLEVDVKPIPLKKGEREDFFVNRFQEIFPILKHTLPTLFAGKILAILYRPYCRGRDYYDLIWYLARKERPNLDYLNRGLTRHKPFKAVQEVYQTLSENIKTVKPEIILKDIGRFLEDPKETDWISRYAEVYNQLTRE